MLKYKVGAYVRLSNNDKFNDNNSIDNQKLIIEQYVKEHDNLELVDYYIDNGYTGSNFERPEFWNLYDDILKEKINCIIVKDLSRFGRDSGWCNVYLNELVIKHNTRFIAINDNIDSFDNPNFTDELRFSILNLAYEQYAVEISKKITSIKRMQQEKGYFVGAVAPYGYIKDPDNCHKLIIDKEASIVVKRIFDMALKCKSSREIVDTLNEENIYPPSKYKAEVTKVNSNAFSVADKWDTDMIRKILTNEVYIGNMIQGKIKKPIRKLNKLVKTKKEELIRVENTHEAIISKNNFETVQRILNYTPTMLKPDDILLRYLKCFDCGGKFYKKKTKSNVYYYCNNFHRNKNCSGSHTIIKKIIEEIVLEDLKVRLNKDIKSLTNKLVEQNISIIYVHENGKIEIDYKNK